MKNLEKIAIDTMVNEFSSKYKEMIDASKSAKAALEMAQTNFKKIIGPLINVAKESGTLLLQDEASDEAIKYFEDKMTEIVKYSLKLKAD